MASGADICVMKVFFFCLCIISVRVCLSETDSNSSKNYIVILRSFGIRRYQDDSLSRSDYKERSLYIQDRLLKKVNARSKIYGYTELVNGFSATLTTRQAKSLKEDSEVLFMVEDKKVKLSTTHSFEFIGLNNATYGAWKKTTGTDVIIGVVDTGLWPESDSFSEKGFGPVPKKFQGICQKGTDKNFSCNRKLIGARFFGKALAAESNLNLSQLVKNCGDYLSPRDSHGHGSHTASIASGSIVSNAKLGRAIIGSPHGVAYSARIVAYKVFWCGGEATVSDILSAIEAAVSDGVDVLSLSLSVGIDDENALQNPLYYFAYLATLEGVSVVFSAGNNGPFWFSVSNAVPWVFTVGSSTLDRTLSSSLILSNNISLTGLSWWGDGGTAGKSEMKFYPLVLASKVAFPGKRKKAVLCRGGSLNSTRTAGKIVICARDVISEQVSEVHRSGGVGTVLYNSEAMGSSLDFPDDAGSPAILLSDKDGLSLLNYMASAKNPKAYLSGIQFITGKAIEAPMVSLFSSVGPNGGSLSIIKPDIIGPGEAIIAANTQKDGQLPWNIRSGTSMACPHVAGAVALLKAFYPTWRPSMIFSALMTTATTKTNQNNPIQSWTMNATPFHMGGGHVNPNVALDPGLVYPISPSGYSAFLCSESGLGSVFCFNQQKTRAIDLNVPSVSFYNVSINRTHRTSRTVEIVGPPGRYHSFVKSPEGSQLYVSPSRLDFSLRSRTLRFKVVMKPSVKSEDIPNSLFVSADQYFTFWTFGYITWYDTKGHKIKINVALNAA